MKKLLFVTAIAAVCCTQVFAGSSCSTCPTAPQKDTTKPEEKTEAEKTEAEKSKENPTLNLLAANSSSSYSSMDSSSDSNSSGSTTDSDSSNSSDDQSSSSQSSSKMLLAGGTQPTSTPTTPAPEGTNDNLTQEQKDLQKQQPPQMLA